MNNITDRDKKLLYGLGIIVIVALFYLIAFKPLGKSISEYNTKIEKEQETHDTMEMKVMRKAVLETMVDNMSTSVNEMKTRYYSMMDSSRVDEQLTESVISYGLVVKDLNISMPTDPVLLSPYTYSSAAQNAAARAAAAAAAAASAEAAGTEETESDSSDIDITTLGNSATDTSMAGIYSASVTLIVTGDKSKEEKLLDDLLDDSSILINSYSFEASSTDLATVTDDGLTVSSGNTYKFTVTLQMFMYKEDVEE